MRRAVRVVSGVAAALVAATLSSFVGLLIFGFGVCSAFDDSGGPFPAGDSPQGRVCGGSSHASLLEELAVWSIPAAGVLAVVLVVAAWRWGSVTLQLAGLVGLIAMPLLAVAPLAAPSDTCSADDVGKVGWDCETES